MDRREALTALAAGAAGLTVAAPAQADHGAAPASVVGPLGQMHLYLCAFHIVKKDPGRVIEAHHYCMPVGDEVHQCVIFDGNGKNARILGVEYISATNSTANCPTRRRSIITRTPTR